MSQETPGLVGCGRSCSGHSGSSGGGATLGLSVPAEATLGVVAPDLARVDAAAGRAAGCPTEADPCGFLCPSGVDGRRTAGRCLGSAASSPSVSSRKESDWCVPQLLLRREVFKLGPCGIVSCGFHDFEGGGNFFALEVALVFRSACGHLVSSLSDEGSRSSRGVGGALRLNSLGTVILVDACTRPVTPSPKSDVNAFLQLILFFRMRSRTSRFLSSTFSCSNS